MKNKLDMPYVTVIQPGISSIQDDGRFGYLSEGIPISGYMDHTAAGLANLLVGNPLNLACIEWAMLPPKLQFNEKAIIAVTGVETKIYINKKEAKLNKSICVPKGAIVSFGVIKNGVYGYISIHGGFQTKKILGSQSWFLQITEHQFFFKGLQIPFSLNKNNQNSNTRLANNYKKKSNETLEVYPGPEFNLLTINQQNSLFNTSFRPSVNRNRMGIQLESDFEKHKFTILSSPVLPGTVQWTPSGKLIVLMKDAQTIGGYPRLLQLSREVLSKLAQLDSDFNFSLKR